MRGTRAKLIRKETRSMVDANPELWEKYSFKKLYRHAKVAWMDWHE